MVVAESLYLAALLSAFVGLIALLVLSGPEIARSARTKDFLAGVIITATILSVGSLFLYALSSHAAARSIYRAALTRSAQV
jgi:ABC-type enterobactin transport system permease subunit